MPGSSQRVGLASLSAAILAALLALPSFAEIESESESAQSVLESETSETVSASSSQDDAEEMAPAPRPGFLDKLQVHGFLTQAYAEASFVQGGLFPSPSSLESSIGIPEDGTTDYRFLALQFRYEISPKDIMVVQLSSRALGNSPVQTVEDEVELDWAFYERRLSDTTGIKVGRVQIPIGIYNEIRDVGTILPFYRPPFGWYSEGSFTSETIDGFVLSTTFFSESEWSVNFDVYCCEWEEFEIDPGNPSQAVPVQAKDAYGFQLWLNTPLSELRFGVGANTKRLQGGLEVLRPQGGFKTPESDHFFFSLDGTFNRFTIRSEYRELDSIAFFPLAPDFRLEDFITAISFYVQVGFSITEKFQIWGQLDDVDLEANSMLHLNPEDLDFRTDLGFSLNYRFRPDLVLKLEYHITEEEQGALIPVVLPEGLFFQPISQETDEGNYTILSLSVSF